MLGILNRHSKLSIRLSYDETLVPLGGGGVGLCLGGYEQRAVRREV